MADPASAGVATRPVPSPPRPAAGPRPPLGARPARANPFPPAPRRHPAAAKGPPEVDGLVIPTQEV